jgi:hypothetical protein
VRSKSRDDETITIMYDMSWVDSMTAIIYIYDLGETTMSNCISVYYVPGRLKAECMAAHEN